MSSTPLRIIFAGTPEFAAEHLSHLISEKFDIVACYTQPDRPAGRGKKLQPSAVKQVALAHDIPVYQPVSLKDEDAQRELALLNADLMIVVAYGLILPKVVLELPKLGCINVHGSILPQWRGAAPIQRAVLAGDKETGVTIMQMDVGLDTGDMLFIEKCDISDSDTSGSVYEKLQQLGPKALVSAVYKIASGDIAPTQQNNDDATYAHKLTKEEAVINWNESAEQIERNIRGYQPWPVATVQLSGNTVKVWQAKVLDESSHEPAGTILSADKNGVKVVTGNGVLNLLQLQPPGKKAMTAADFVNGRSEWVTPGILLK